MNSKEVVLAFWDAMKTNDLPKRVSGLVLISKAFGLNQMNLHWVEKISQLLIPITPQMVFGSLKFIR